jgi:hypothetical protein
MDLLKFYISALNITQKSVILVCCHIFVCLIPDIYTIQYGEHDYSKRRVKESDRLPSFHSYAQSERPNTQYGEHNYASMRVRESDRMPSFHSYAQSETPNTQFGEHDYASRRVKESDRLPSFHSYAQSVTPKKQKGKRCRGTPTGLTPIPPSKIIAQVCTVI